MAKTSVPLSSPFGKQHVPIAIHVPPVVGIFERISDWRKERGKVYPLVSLLLVVLAALMCGKEKVKAMARWCKELSFLDRGRLGLPFGRSPAATAAENRSGGSGSGNAELAGRGQCAIDARRLGAADCH